MFHYYARAMKKRPQKKLTKTGSEVVTLALHRLGGAQRPIDTEDVAMEVHRLAPVQFSWRKYPDQINLDLVRIFLVRARESELLIGSGRNGWRLTQRGLKWAEQVGGLAPVRTRAQSRSGSIDEQRWRRERSRIVATHAWQLWTSGVRDIPLAETKQVFRIDSYAHGELRETKITRLRAMFADDQELTPFLAHLIEDLNKEATA
jgi:hypothetical protein